jgi:hypothetical protein
MAEMNPIVIWPRDHYEPGGGDALVFFAVFGQFGEIGPVSRSRYRCDGVPSSLQVMKYGPDSRLEVVAGFRSGPVWEFATKDNPALADEIHLASECIVISGEVPDPSDLNYLRDVTGFITYLLDIGGCAVYDPQRIVYWTAAQWRTNFFDAADGAPLRHTIILVSEEGDGTKWFHTRGMRKFGRPDLSVHHVPPEFEAAVHDLLSRFIVFQADGGVIADAQEITMNSLPSGLRCHVTGDVDDPDFNNTHFEIGVRHGTGPFRWDD